MSYQEKCFNCRHFTRYYTKGKQHFTKTEFGFCNKIKAISEKNNYCERFTKKQPSKPIYESTISHSLHEICLRLIEMKQIYEAELNSTDNK